MKNQNGFAVLALVILLAGAGAIASGAVTFHKWQPTINKQATKAAFKTGKASDWANLNK